MDALPNKVGDVVDARVELANKQANPHYVMSQLESMILPMQTQMNNIEERLADNGGQIEEQDREYITQGIVHTWNGSMHVVPEGYIFPSFNTYDHWNLWHFGVRASGIGPHSEIKASLDFPGSGEENTNSRTNYTKVSKVMKYMVGIWDAPVNRTNSEVAFDSSYSILISRIYGATGTTNRSTKNCKTIYSKLIVYKKNNGE